MLLFLQISNGYVDPSDQPRNGEHRRPVCIVYSVTLYILCTCYIGKLQVTSDHPLLLASRNNDYSIVAPLISQYPTDMHSCGTTTPPTHYPPMVGGGPSREQSQKRGTHHPEFRANSETAQMCLSLTMVDTFVNVCKLHWSRTRDTSH